MKKYLLMLLVAVLFLVNHSPNAVGKDGQDDRASLLYAVTVATANTTYNALTTDDVILLSVSTTPSAVNLPPAAANPGKAYTIRKTDSSFNAISIAPDGSDTINGAASTTLNTQSEVIELVSDGVSDWQIKGKTIPTAWTSYTPTLVGFGAGTSNISVLWSREGQNIKVRGYWTNGTVTGSVFTVSLPSGLTVDTSAIPGNQKSYVGRWVQATSSGSPSQFANTGDGILHFDSTVSTSAVQFILNGVNSVLANSNGVGNTGYGVAFEFEAPVTGWNG